MADTKVDLKMVTGVENWTPFPPAFDLWFFDTCKGCSEYFLDTDGSETWLLDIGELASRYSARTEICVSEQANTDKENYKGKEGGFTDGVSES